MDKSKTQIFFLCFLKHLMQLYQTQKLHMQQHRQTFHIHKLFHISPSCQAEPLHCRLCTFSQKTTHTTSTHALEITHVCLTFLCTHSLTHSHKELFTFSKDVQLRTLRINARCKFSGKQHDLISPEYPSTKTNPASDLQ